jgi:hypothetical protein
VITNEAAQLIIVDQDFFERCPIAQIFVQTNQSDYAGDLAEGDGELYWNNEVYCHLDYHNRKTLYVHHHEVCYSQLRQSTV